MNATELAGHVFKAKSPEKLADLALSRTDWANSDIGCGVRYPGDDEAPVPPDHVELYAGWDDFEATIPEREYLTLLAAHLDAVGASDAALRVRDYSQSFQTREA